jgi:hypothetical protein
MGANDPIVAMSGTVSGGAGDAPRNDSKQPHWAAPRKQVAQNHD